MDIKRFDSRFQILRIQKIIKENSTTNTYVFQHFLDAKPGQFLMMWIPGVDEKPMSVAFADKNEFWVTACKVGLFSEALHGLKVGDKVGIRGPLGTHYNFKKGDRLALVAGGYGAAPMYFVANEAVKAGCRVEFLIGARSEDLLLYTQKILGLGGVNLHISTNDGSVGFKGFVTVLLESILKKKKMDFVFSCGPEVMMNAVGKVCEKFKTRAYMSMEKYMKCGIGVCGQCAIDDTGDLVCRKGPVMSWNYLKKLPEMGAYHRDAQGKKHYMAQPQEARVLPTSGVADQKSERSEQPNL